MAFSFVQITDHHLTTTDQEYVKGFSTRYSFRTVLNHIAKTVGEHIDFIISTGDVVDRPSPISYEAVRALLSIEEGSTQAPGPLTIHVEGMKPMPTYFLPGNHDDRQWFYQTLFRQNDSAYLMNASFVHQGVQFIHLDWGPGVKAATHPETLAFLRQKLQSGLPSILLMHHQITSIGSRWLDRFVADDVQGFYDVITGQNILGMFCGHVHHSTQKTVQGIPMFSLHATAFTFALQDEPMTCLEPPQYRLVTVHENILTTRTIEVPL